MLCSVQNEADLFRKRTSRNRYFANSSDRDPESVNQLRTGDSGPCAEANANCEVCPTPKLRAASPADYPFIRSLLIANDLRAFSFERWMQLWRENPAQRNWPTECPAGWVLEADHNEIVGYVGNIPLLYWFRGRELRAASGSGLVVSKSYRPYAMLLLDSLIEQEGLDLLINTTVSAVAEPILKFFEFSRVPVGEWDKSQFWITNCLGFSRSVLRAKSIPAASALSYFMGPVLSCKNGFQSKLNGGSLKVEQCTDFDERFDVFWEKLKIQNNDVLLGVRNRETLAWRFHHALSEQNAWVLTVSQAGQLVGYAIFDRLDSARFHLKRVRLIDFQALKDSEQMLSAFLASMLDACRTDGVHVLEVTGCWLDRLGFTAISPPHERSLGCWTSYYLAKEKGLSETLKDPSVWAPSGFDGDSSLLSFS